MNIKIIHTGFRHVDLIAERRRKQDSDAFDTAFHTDGGTNMADIFGVKA